MLFVGEKGFNGEKIISDNLNKFKDLELGNNIAETELLCKKICEKLNMDNRNPLSLIKYFEEKLTYSSKVLDEIANEYKDVLHGTKIKPYKGLTEIKISKNHLKYFSFTSEEFDNLIKNNKSIGIEIKNNFLFHLKNCLKNYKYLLILRTTYKTESILRVLKTFQNVENEVKRYLNIVEGDEISKKIKSILDKDNGVPYAFCKLGEKISHFLIDEFQDTSHAQFDAMEPLLENALAEGGTLFAVGDKKQAIYAWRGGDYKIFDKLKKTFKPNKELIKENFRSYANIIHFNNKIFNSENLISKINTLLEDDEIIAKEIGNEIEQIYRESNQNQKQKGSGYIKATIKRDEQQVVKEDFYKETLKKELTKLLEKVNVSDIMILLRTKNQIKTVVNWLRDDFPNINFITEDALTILNNFEIKKLLLIATFLINIDNENYSHLLKESEIEIDMENFTKDLGSISPYELFSKILSEDIIDKENNELYITAFMEKVLELQEKCLGLDKIIDYFYENTDITVSLPENIDAVKIMTIHKSKGLESHSVIIPFYDWKFTDTRNLSFYDTININELIDIDTKILIKINRSLGQISTEARKKYIKRYLTEFIESLNLMYVANTRARENLIIIGLYKKEANPALLLQKIFQEEDFENESNELIIEMGEISKSLNKKQEEQNFLTMKYNSDIKNFLKIYPNTFDLTVDFEDKYFGDLFHLAMSFIGELSEKDDMDIIVDKAYEKAVNMINYENKLVKIEIKKAIEKLKYYFFDLTSYWNEKEIIDKTGLLHRIDRLVEKDNKYFVIEYKTGNPNRQHINQVKNYKKELKNSECIIYYAKSGEILHV
jgi:ATP-dependent exoDNAse (exonuclease V) beta subunit